MIDYVKLYNDISCESYVECNATIIMDVNFL